MKTWSKPNLYLIRYENLSEHIKVKACSFFTGVEQSICGYFSIA